MQKNFIAYSIAGVVLLLLVGLLFSKSPTSKTAPVSATPASVTTSAASDPQDIVPGLYENRIHNTATQAGFTITAAQVENNTDPAGKIVDDHLEITLKNTTPQDLTDFEAYYTITDPSTNKKEGYYKKLSGFVLKKDQTASIHFDNQTGVGHVSANKNSIYYSSSNQLLFDVSVSTPGYAVQTIHITKDAGGAEQKD